MLQSRTGKCSRLGNNNHDTNHCLEDCSIRRTLIVLHGVLGWLGVLSILSICKVLNLELFIGVSQECSAGDLEDVESLESTT